MYQISYLLLLFFIILSTTITINVEDDSDDDIQLTNDMWVSSLTKESVDVDPRQMLTVTKDKLLLSRRLRWDQKRI